MLKFVRVTQTDKMADSQPQEKKAEKEKPRIIVIAMDGSEYSKYAFHWYTQNIYRDNDKIYIVHAVEFNENIPSKWLHEHDTVTNSIEPVLKEERTKCQEKLDMLEQLLKNSGMQGEVHAVSAKKPGEGILRKATELGASCVVTGTRGQSSIKRTLLGSVSDYILHHAIVPVIICRYKETVFA